MTSPEIIFRSISPAGVVHCFIKKENNLMAAAHIIIVPAVAEWWIDGMSHVPVSSGQEQQQQ